MPPIQTVTLVTKIEDFYYNFVCFFKIDTMIGI